MTAHFTIPEFVRSDLATRRGIDNALPDGLQPAALATLEMLERIRTRLSALARRDVSISISSGYRCTALNAAVGSALTSDHPHAAAADFTAPSFGSPIDICRALAPLVDELGIGQLIHEFGQWCHVSTRIPQRMSNRVITISHAGTVAGIVEA